MKILGIETSCDETAVTLLEADGAFPDRTGGTDFKFDIRGNALFSQASLHAEYGGVFPNLAKREHAKNLVPLLEQTLAQALMLETTAVPSAGALLLPLKELLEREPELFTALAAFALRYQKPDIDCIAVTYGPGLEPALWVGINFARALSLIWNVPIVAVNHMEGHIIASMMRSDENQDSRGTIHEFEYPVLALLISGGHTELVLSKKFGEYEVIGETRDDAAGEAFDKVARLLDLPYPGGPEVSRLAKDARKKNLQGDFKFTRPMLRDDNFDFSFSGLKTAVRNIVKVREPLTDELKMQIAREFEECVADVLIEKTMRAADVHGAQTVIVGGGVSANEFIRERLATRIMNEGSVVRLLVPAKDMATDNAIMIALAGYFRALNKEFADPLTIKATGNLRLSA